MSARRMLIVDDEQSVRDVMGQFFWSEGFEVCQAGGGAEALRMVGEKSFDVVVTDLRIPNPDGLEVLRQIKQIQPNTVVLVFTGYPSVETKLRAKELGGDGYLTKPVRLNEMNSLVNQGLMSRKIVSK